MRLRDLVGFAATALWRHRLRTGLSLLGVAIGVLAVVGLTALGEGARRYVVNQFANLGTNLLIVIPGRTETTGALPGVGGVPNDLTLEDAAALRRQLAGAKRVVPVVVGSETVSAPDRSRQVPIIGSTEGFRHARRLDIGSG
ncbi:MAG: ABC transporter permease, partial [Planctomycetota bacterium]